MDKAATVKAVKAALEDHVKVNQVLMASPAERREAMLAAALNQMKGYLANVDHVEIKDYDQCEEVARLIVDDIFEG